MNKINCMGYPVLKGDLNQIPTNDKILINTISPNSYGLATINKQVEEALKKSDILVLDGEYFGLYPRLLMKEKINRITGWDCFIFFMNKLNYQSGKAFFLGSTTEVLEKIKIRAAKEYPKVRIGYFSPPFKETFTQEENKIMLDTINSFAPNVLFIGMTAPKQEIWSFSHKDQLSVNIIVSIGNVFDWYAQVQRRPGKIWQKLKLEWLIRIFMRPEILKRNIYNQMIFFKDLLLTLLKIKDPC